AETMDIIWPCAAPSVATCGGCRGPMRGSCRSFCAAGPGRTLTIWRRGKVHVMSDADIEAGQRQACEQFERACRKLGRDLAEVFERRRAEVALAAVLGIDPARGGAHF